MKMKFKEIWQELKSVLTGTTLDALLPPIVFAILNALFGLAAGAVGALVLSLGLGVFRLIRNQRWLYALAGLLLAGLASGLGLLTENAGNYFIPSIVTSALLTLAALISNLIGKPLAAWASHLTRGWPLDWFWREDVKPAYREVTWAWTVFFSLRLALQVFLFTSGRVDTLAWTETLLGWPVTIVVLILSYVYGIWRLRKLGGPGVDEFQEGKAPPWKGQTRGF
ncbi:DUF3159 domain-containing protein [bacterium]|nr:DUF3159 domain-containing protein [bacterium]